jgi:hypothetical protein
MLFLLWFDDSKKSIEQKIAGGIAAYTERFSGIAPKVVGVSQIDLDSMNGATVKDVEIVTKSYIRRNNFWIGREAP